MIKRRLIFSLGTEYTPSFVVSVHGVLHTANACEQNWEADPIARTKGLPIGTDSMGSWSGSAGNKSLHECEVRACGRIAGRLQHGVLAQIKSSWLATTRSCRLWPRLGREAVACQGDSHGMLSSGHVTAGCRAPTHTRMRTYSMYPPYVIEYATFMAIIARLGTLAHPEDYVLPWALSGSLRTGTRRSLSSAVRVGPEHVPLAQCHQVDIRRRQIGRLVSL